MPDRDQTSRTPNRRVSARSALLAIAATTALLVPVQFDGVASAQGAVPGSLDPAFDTDGIAINELVSTLSGVQDAARLPDGRVLVLANDRVWRFSADGTLDTSFDQDGVRLPASSDRLLRPSRLALRPGGGFVISTGVSNAGFNAACPTGQVAKFDADGDIDTGFGTNGVACIGFTGFDGSAIADVIVQGDDRVVLLGAWHPSGGGTQVSLVRLSTTGAVANSVVQALNSTFEFGDDMALEADGDIVVAANANTFPDFNRIDVVLSRYDGATLALDTGFGGEDGINVLTTSLDNSRSPVRLALEADGGGMSVIVAGYNEPAEGGELHAMEQLLADEDGFPADGDRVVMEVPSVAGVTVDDLTATATGYLAVGHYEDQNTGQFSTGMVAVALGQEAIDPFPELIAHPRADVAHRGGVSLLQPDGMLLHVSNLHGPDGEQLLFNRLIEEADDPRTVRLDPTIGTAFGEPGFRAINAGTADRGEAVVVQPDSKVLVGGHTSAANAGPAVRVGDDGFVLRHNEDGSLDSAFGGPQRPGVAFLDFKVNAVAMTPAPDDRLIAVGGRRAGGEDGPGERGFVQRLLASGAPDTTWNGGQPLDVSPGAVGTFPGAFLRDVAVQPDGKIVVVGDYHNQTCTGDGCTSQNWITVARVDQDGTIDDTFGTAGFTQLGPVSGTDPTLAQGRGVALQPDGRIVVTGNLGDQLVVARLTATGAADPTFASPAGPFGPGVLADDLVAGTDTDRGRGRDVALRSDGRIAVSGAVLLQECDGEFCFTRTEAIAVQYTSTGTRDVSFGTGGLAQLGAPGDSEGNGVAVDGADNLVVAGSATGANTGRDVLLARLLPTGLPDLEFGTSGLVSTHVDQSEAGNGLAIAPDGRLVVAGVHNNTRGDRVLTARYQPGGALSCEPSPLDFGAVVVDTDATEAVTCTNTGAGRVRVTAVATSGAHAADFVPAAGSCSAILSPGESCQVPVTFTPADVDARSATLNVSHSAQGASGPASVALRGTGIARDTTLRFDPATLVFAEQLGLSTSPAQTVTVTNAGTVPITVNGVGIENDPAGDFAVSASTCTGVTLPPGGTCQVSVTFTPKATGGRTATLRFDDTAVGTPHRLPLTGTAATPALIVNPGLGRPGALTLATGTKFPPNQVINLTWVEPVSLTGGGFPEPAFTATSNAGGTFTANVLAFPKSRIGGRILLATIGPFTANAPFLVTPGTLQGPDYVYRR